MNGAVVVVRRGDEILVLRRAQYHDNGDWQWTPPSGAREPGESAEENAARELREETGLELRLTLVRDEPWAVFVADAPADAVVVLDGEHTAYEWLSLDDACRRCTPSLVAEGIRAAVG